MPKLPTRFQAALATICALGDEAHYEQRPRHVSLDAEAMAIIEGFDTVRERADLVIAWTDSYDIAAARQVIALDLGALVA